jgi:hypothetical protein
MKRKMRLTEPVNLYRLSDPERRMLQYLGIQATADQVVVIDDEPRVAWFDGYERLVLVMIDDAGDEHCIVPEDLHEQLITPAMNWRDSYPQFRYGIHHASRAEAAERTQAIATSITTFIRSISRPHLQLVRYE